METTVLILKWSKRAGGEGKIGLDSPSDAVAQRKGLTEAGMRNVRLKDASGRIISEAALNEMVKREANA